MTLDEMVAVCVQHTVDHPTHGVMCACMDDLVRRVRRLTDVPITLDYATARTAEMRVNYVLGLAVKHRTLHYEAYIDGGEYPGGAPLGRCACGNPDCRRWYPSDSDSPAALPGR